MAPWALAPTPVTTATEVDLTAGPGADTQQAPASGGQAPNAMCSFGPIGYVEVEPGEGPLDNEPATSVARIVLEPSLASGLQGLEPGQRLVVVFLMHLSSGFELLQHSRGDRSRPQRGVFALRSPHRPNPIGLTEVEILSIDANVLTVSGLDALHRPPVLDLKPALKHRPQEQEGRSPETDESNGSGEATRWGEGR